MTTAKTLEPSKKFEAIEFPSKKNEHWRFGAPKKLNQFWKDYIENSSKTEANSVKIEVTGLTSEAIIAGVRCLDFASDTSEITSLIGDFSTATRETLGSEKWANLNQTYRKGGACIYIPKDVVVTEPITVNYQFSGAGFFAPYTLIIAEENSSAAIIERFESLDAHGAIFSMAHTEAKKNSKISSSLLQVLNSDALLWRAVTTYAHDFAELQQSYFHFGGDYTRQDWYAKILGKEATLDLFAINIINNEHSSDIRTFQHHAQPHSVSNLLFKNTLYNKALSTFSGLIKVDEGAHFTDAYQTCRNLLMDETALSHSMPGLEINADQVKCSHGSTSSTIHADEIYYLLARGIKKETAQFLIARGFSMEVIERINNEQVQEIIEKSLDNYLQSL